MKIAFCGHSQIENATNIKNKVAAYLETLPKGEITFFLGGYGDFDHLCLECCKKYNETATDKVSLLFVTPYLSERYIKNRSLYIEDCDSLIYPELENTPKKYAISRRNKWMIDRCDLLICFINRNWGGAYQTFRYARSKAHCKIVNVAEI